jgi:hypothetical protein
MESGPITLPDIVPRTETAADQIPPAGSSSQE